MKFQKISISQCSKNAKKIHFFYFNVMRGDFGGKFEMETSTLIFSANNELAIVEHEALEFTEHSLSI